MLSRLIGDCVVPSEQVAYSARVVNISRTSTLVLETRNRGLTDRRTCFYGAPARWIIIIPVFDAGIRTLVEFSDICVVGAGENTVGDGSERKDSAEHVGR